MRKILLNIFIMCLVPVVAGAAVRDGATIKRATTTPTQQRTANVSPRSAATPTTARTATTSRDITSRTAGANTVSRSAVARGTVTPKTAARSATTTSTARGATTTRTATTNTIARAATNGAGTAVLGDDYDACHAAYFTCMDQFCGKQNETYRRCVCSSRLDEIKTKERAIAQTGDRLQDFADLNLDVIDKTGAEVKAMLSATTGEVTATQSKDKSDSAIKLAGISAVLNKTKTQALSTQGTLDIAGDIDAIWSTTDIAAGADIANLSGESLYNAVHAQCAEFVADSCTNKSTLNMVVSAYGMYIENDCTTLSNALAKQTTAASGTIRQAEREMNIARLENYNAHNSLEINDCIARVRQNITSDMACGKNYVHCLDITGQYLNYDTGEPIYSAIFYQLETLTSLTGDVLTNQTNRMLVAELNRKKEFAGQSLDTCRDLADDVWDEFMRQAIAEIYQGQQTRIRQVKNECIDVVHNCYDTQSKSLKDFSNVKEQLLLGARLELSEEMCRVKLDACSNLYGGGDTGLSELIATMRGITDQKIAQNCAATLAEYVLEICAVPSNDTLHSYPYACRTYAPGEQLYASNPACNSLNAENTTGGGTGDTSGISGTTKDYSCDVNAMFEWCPTTYFLAKDGIFNPTPTIGNRCLPCLAGHVCTGGLTAPQPNSDYCGTNYVGSLYQKVVRYAMQTCVRPSQANDPLPATILSDVNMVMDQVRIAMGLELATECERLGGVWVDTPWQENTTTGHELDPTFYFETSANTTWGYCARKSSTAKF